MLVCVSIGYGDHLTGFALYIQFVIGMLIGVPLMFIREIGLLIGTCLDTSRGQTLRMILNPGSDEMASPLGGTISEAVWYLCILKGVLPLTIYVYLVSYRIFPLAVEGRAFPFSEVGELILGCADILVDSIVPMMLILMAMMIVVDYFFVFVSAVWKLDGLTNEHYLLRSGLVFVTLLVALNFDLFDFVSEAMSSVLAITSLPSSLINRGG
jgi:type III secretory pathway component EscT